MHQEFSGLSFTSYWKSTCLVFSFTTLKTIAVAVLFAASSWQSWEMGNGKILGIQISTHSYAIFQGILLILFTCLCSFKSVEIALSLSEAGLVVVTRWSQAARAAYRGSNEPSSSELA